MNNFSQTILGTAGTGQRQPTHPGDKPLSLSGEQYLALLWKQTDASIRLDLARFGEIRRWDWKKLGETKLHRPVAGAEKWSRRQPVL